MQCSPISIDALRLFANTNDNCIFNAFLSCSKSVRGSPCNVLQLSTKRRPLFETKRAVRDTRNRDRVDMSRKSNQTGWKVKLSRQIWGNQPYHQSAGIDQSKQKLTSPVFRDGGWTTSPWPGSDLDYVPRHKKATNTHKQSERIHVQSSIKASREADSLPGSRLKSCRACDRITSGCHSRLLLSSQRPRSKTFPEVVEILSERAESWWKDYPAPEFAGGQPMNTAPRAFQPKRRPQSFRVNLTKPYAFSYYKT